MNITNVLVVLTIDTENLPENFQEILKREREVVAQWKKEGVLEFLFLRPARNGAVLIFKGLDEQKVNELMVTLPFYQLKKSIEVLPLIRDPEL